MSDHLLFLVGVVDSEFRTPREKAEPVVRCLEDELAPYRDARPRCIDCGADLLSDGGKRDQGDGSLFDYRHCKECGARYRVVAE